MNELPIATTSNVVTPSVTTGKLEPMLVPVVETLHWGISIQYSTYYLAGRFTGGLPKEEPLNQFVPLVEFKIDCLRGQIRHQ